MIIHLIVILLSQSFCDTPSRIKSIFPGSKGHYKVPLIDGVSKEGNNTVLWSVKGSDGKTIGLIRPISTTTGCNSACLPLVFSLVYDKKGKFKKLVSTKGLTKKGHKAFDAKDYLKLDLILSQAPPVLDKVGHPKEMVDGLTEATKKEFRPWVVKQAAYTTLRAHLYNQETLKFLKGLLTKNSHK